MSAEATIANGVDIDVDSLMRLRGLTAGSHSRRPLAAPAAGNVLRRQRGRGVETYDVRPWSEGDDIRRLDRNVTARTGSPHVRTFHDERERSALYLVDFRPSMLFGTRRAFRSVAAAEVSVLGAWRTLDHQGRVGLAVVTSIEARLLGWANHPRALPPLLERLVAAHRAAIEAKDVIEPPLADAIDGIDSASGSAMMTIATALDTPGENFDAVAGRVAQRRGLDVLLIADRFEVAPPPGVFPFRTRAGETGLLRIGRRHAVRAPDVRQPRLRRLGARVLEIDAGLDTGATARALERFDDRSG